jgi:OmpA-OmpF porin, OOP family
VVAIVMLEVLVEGGHSSGSTGEEPPRISRATADVRPLKLPPLDFRELDSGDLAVDLDAGVYFSFDSAELTVKARSQLREALLPQAREFLADGGEVILVQGYTDGLGSDAYNLSLSRERAESVATLLIAGGIPSGSIKADGRGEAGAENGVADPGARRVVVILRGGAP